MLYMIISYFIIIIIIIKYMTIDIRNIKAYVINLDKNIEKYDNIKKRFFNLGINPERFKAIYAKELDNEYIKKVTHPFVQNTIENGRYIDSDIGTLGAVGCSLSHIKLWEMLLNSNEDMFLILEDDASINSYYINDINEYLNKIYSIDKNWDYIFLGYLKPTIKSVDIKVSNDIYKVNEITFQTHAYIINKSGAQKLLKNSFPIIHQIDSYISLMSMYRNLNAYRGKKYIIQKNEKGTDIQTDNSIKIYINRLSNNSIKIILLIFILLLLNLFFLFVYNFTYKKFKY